MAISTDDGNDHTGSSNAFEVTHGPLDHFTWDAIPSPQQVAVPFPVKITAQDTNGFTVTGFEEAIALSAATGSGPTEATVGTGTSTWSFPFSTYYHDGRTQTIYLASELPGPGIIEWLALDVTTIPGQTMSNWTIRIKHTALDAYSSASWEGPSSGWSAVYRASEARGTTGWRTFAFSQPFQYNGTDNLIIDFSYNNSSYTSDGQVRSTSTGANRSIYYCTDSGYGDPLTWSGTSPSPSVTGTMPNVRLGFGDRIVAMTPENSGDFADGVWQGQVTINEEADGVAVMADDGGEHVGQTLEFDIWPAVEITEGTVVPVIMDEEGAPRPFELQLHVPLNPFADYGWSVSVVADHGTADVTGNRDTAVVEYVPEIDWTGTDSFEITVIEAHGGGTDAIAVNVTVENVNDAPAVDLNGAAGGIDYTTTFAEDGGAVAVCDAAALSVVDVDDTELESASVTITSVLDGAAESLSAETGGRGISASYDPATGILSLTGTASVAEYQTVLRTMTYQNTSQDPTTTARSITFVTNDGDADSAVATCAVTVEAENNVPVIVGQEVLSTPEETELAIGLGDLQVTDPDNTYPDELSLTVQDGSDYSRTGNTVTPAAEFNGTLTVPVVVNDGTTDSNTYNLAVTVTAVADAPVITGQEVLTTPEETALAITLSHLHVTDPDSTYPGDFTLSVQDGANYTRNGSSITPVVDFNGQLTVPVVVNDGGLDSNAYDLGVSVTAVNDAPALDLDAETAGIDYAAAFVEDGGPVSIVDTDGLSIGDVDDAEFESAQVVITNVLDGAAEVLSADAGETGIGVSYDPGTGILSLTGTAALADYQAVLRTVTYTNTSQDPHTTARVIEFTVNDGDSGSPTSIAELVFFDEIALELQFGWNLSSLPFGTDATEGPAAVLIDGNHTPLFAGNVWVWNPQETQYQELVGPFTGKIAFWVFSPSEDAVTTAVIRGCSETGSVYLYPGWNLIGPTAYIPLAEVNGIENITGTVWRWDAVRHAYEAVRGNGGVLERGRGYWIFLDADERCWIKTGN